MAELDFKRDKIFRINDFLNLRVLSTFHNLELINVSFKPKFLKESFHLNLFEINFMLNWLVICRTKYKLVLD